MDICRFKGLNDSEYEKVAAALRHISQVIKDNAGQQSQSDVHFEMSNSNLSSRSVLRDKVIYHIRTESHYTSN